MNNKKLMLFLTTLEDKRIIDNQIVIQITFTLDRKEKLINELYGFL